VALPPPPQPVLYLRQRPVSTVRGQHTIKIKGQGSYTLSAECIRRQVEQTSCRRRLPHQQTQCAPLPPAFDYAQ